MRGATDHNLMGAKFTLVDLGKGPERCRAPLCRSVTLRILRTGEAIGNGRGLTPDY